MIQIKLCVTPPYLGRAGVRICPAGGATTLAHPPRGPAHWTPATFWPRSRGHRLTTAPETSPIPPPIFPASCPLALRSDGPPRSNQLQPSRRRNNCVGTVRGCCELVSAVCGRCE